MSTRQSYVSPAIVTEDVLEQTSLACNATQAFNLVTNPNAFAPGLPVQCQIDVSKGGNFASPAACQNAVASDLTFANSEVCEIVGAIDAYVLALS